MLWKLPQLRPPLVEFVALEGQVLTVCSPIELHGERPRVRVRQGGRTVSSRLLPASVREVPAGFLYTGLVMRNLRRLKPGIQAEVDWLRRSERIPLRGRLHSRQLPGFHATTVDLNATGVLLEGNQSIEVGRLLEVNLETPHRSLALRARVAWAERMKVVSCRMGLEFLGDIAAVEEVYDRLRQEREDDARRRWMGSPAPF